MANPATLGWAGAAAAFALALLLLPGLAGILHAGPVPPLPALIALGAALVLPLWLEGAKRLRVS